MCVWWYAKAKFRVDNASMATDFWASSHKYVLAALYSNTWVTLFLANVGL